MARPVDEAARRAVIRILLLPRPEGVVAGAPDDVLDDRVYLAAGHSGPERANAGVLSAHHDLVHLPNLGRRFAFRYGARHVRPVPGRLVLREDVHDDRLVRVERAGPALVRVRPLATGKYGGTATRVSPRPSRKRFMIVAFSSVPVTPLLASSAAPNSLVLCTLVARDSFRARPSSSELATMTSSSTSSSAMIGSGVRSLV